MLLSLLAGAAAAGFQLPPLEEVVIYEANLRAHGPGGGFAALTRRLDDIRQLGVNVLWLMPVNPVGRTRSAGGLGSPYSVSDYDSVNPEFGDSASFGRLVQEAHRRRMGVILDWVPNHTSWDHPWINQHPDWYTHGPLGEIISPEGTNWKDVADLNYDSPELRKAMTSAMKRWVKKGVDGFRVDTADWVPYDYFKEAIPSLRSTAGRRLLFLAEGYRTDHYQAGFDLTYGWRFHDALGRVFGGAKAGALAEAAREEEDGLPPGARRLRFVTNHDEWAWNGRPLDRYHGPAGVKAAEAAAFLWGGTPLIYSGQEAGWTGPMPLFESSLVDWKGGPSSASWLGFLSRVRRSSPAFLRGSATSLCTDDVIAFSRKEKNDEALVLVSARERPVTWLPAKGLQGFWNRAGAGREALSSSLHLAPFEVRVYTRRSAPPTSQHE